MIGHSAEYRPSGAMTFILNRDEVVPQDPGA